MTFQRSCRKETQMGFLDNSCKNFLRREAQSGSLTTANQKWHFLGRSCTELICCVAFVLPCKVVDIFQFLMFELGELYENKKRKLLYRIKTGKVVKLDKIVWISFKDGF